MRTLVPQTVLACKIITHDSIIFRELFHVKAKSYSDSRRSFYDFTRLVEFEETRLNILVDNSILLEDLHKQIAYKEWNAMVI